MKIIEALKQIKDLERKANDLVTEKVQKYCADLDIENPVYGDEQAQRKQVAEWVQAHGDIVKEILRLRVAVQRTNLATPVTIEIPDAKGKRHAVTKPITAWIHRRRDLAKSQAMLFERAIHRANSIQTGHVKTTSGETHEVHVRRYFDQAEFDGLRESYLAEPSLIDGRLEVVNAITDLIE